ncbi:suppressor of cytokine signaling 4-like [Discoglossus pictus]
MSPPASSRSNEKDVSDEESYTCVQNYNKRPLVQDLLGVTRLSCYLGALTQRQAEVLLHGCPDGTFFLRNSSQNGCAFSVTFRRRGRTRHARIQYRNQHFSFHWGSYQALSVRSLLEYYRDPNMCMFFEPLLSRPQTRNFPLGLQELCRATINAHITYEDIREMPLPQSMKEYLWDCHYKETPTETEGNDLSEVSLC